MIWCGKMEYTTGSVVFNDWIITREIGQGATGKVFEIEKSGYGITVKSALKVIRIPKSPSDIQAVRNEGMTMASVEDYFREFVDEILREVRIMVSLKEHPNIVSYEDHCVVPHEVEVGWDVLIKMELLTPLSEWQGTHQMDEQTVIRLGREISSALAYAAEHDLIHRDVKPENIFVNEAGKFKLGDFGIARTIEKTTGGLSKKGTESYMAPEVYHGNPYSRQVDIYSLGIVLYRFLNENRLPFYPPAPQVIKYSDRETAIVKRMGGMELPEPIHGNAELKAVVLKACEYLPENRYDNISEMRNALLHCENSSLKESETETSNSKIEEQKEKRRKKIKSEKVGKKKGIMIGAIIAIMTVVGITTVTVNRNVFTSAKKYQSENEGEIELSEADRSSLEAYAEQSIEMIVGMDDEEAEEVMHPSSILTKVDERVVASVYSWKSAKEKTGEYEQILSQTIEVNSDEIIIQVLCKFEKKESGINITLFRGDLTLKSMEFEDAEKVDIQKEPVSNEINEADRSSLESYAQQSIEMIVGMNDEEIEEILHPSSVLSKTEDTMAAAVEAWGEIKEKLGDYQQILTQEIVANDAEIVIQVDCRFEKKDAVVTITISRDDLNMKSMKFAAK